MKRDFDLIEKILTAMESDTHVNRSDKLIAEHFYLLEESGYISSTYKLTWKGYDLLEYLKWYKNNKFVFEDRHIPVTEEIIKLVFNRIIHC